MQTGLKKFILTLGILSCVFSFAGAQNFPDRSSKLVNDYTNTLNPEEISQLEQKLVIFDDSTSTQIAVVLIKSLEGYDVSDYAVRLAEKWGIGQQKKNNGIIVLVSIGDRKISIQTGYGVEGALPDAIAKRIIENEIKPEFKQGNYYAGLDKGTDAIISYTKGEYKNDKPRQNKGGGSAGFIILIAIIILVIIFRGGRGNGGNQVIGRGGSASPFWWLLMGNALGGGRGGSGSSGWGGGSSSGGGFGGFGGGSFGGGGSSGSW